MTNKMTKRDYFNAIRVMVADNADLVTFVDHELELLDRKNANRKGGLTPTQKANLVLAEDIVAMLEEATAPMSTSAIAKEFEVSTQKVSPIMKKLAADGRVTVTVEKSTKFYTVA